ncbi:MAG: hypothetical protein QOJ66_3290, partial [Ilumatobacteraceae bacterium]
YLQRKVDALSDDSREAQRTGRREFFVQGLTFVAMVLTIAAEGPRIAAPSNDQSEAEVFAAECRSLIEAMRVERSNDIDVTAGASVGVSAVAHGTAYPATVEIKANVPDPTVLVVDET